MTLPRKKRLKKQKQLDFFGKPRREHGGEIRRGKRKLHRPLNTKLPVHIVMRSEIARAKLSLLNHQRAIEKIIRKWADRYQVSVFEIAIVSNHIHLLIRGKKRSSL